MLAPELVAQIRRIELRAHFLASEILVGEYSSTFKGQGMEFDEVREYVPGDDIRTIDWNVTARMNRPFVKIFREEREMTVMLIVDVSQSLAFGTTAKTKIEIAAEFAALIAFLATKNNDRIGLIAYDDRVENFIPPKKGRGHVWRIIRTVLGMGVGKGQRTDIGGALEMARRVLKRRATIFVISDFYSPEFRKQLMQLARSHDVNLARIIDPRELVFNGAGYVSIQDMESGLVTTMSLNNSTPAESDSTRTWLKEQRRGTKVGQFELLTNGNLVTALTNYLRRRDR
jgi:uncharacterized protein (DUF58 family)